MQAILFYRPGQKSQKTTRGYLYAWDCKSKSCGSNPRSYRLRSSQTLAFIYNCSHAKAQLRAIRTAKVWDGSRSGAWRAKFCKISRNRKMMRFSCSDDVSEREISISKPFSLRWRAITIWLVETVLNRNYTSNIVLQPEPKGGENDPRFYGRMGYVNRCFVVLIPNRIG